MRHIWIWVIVLAAPFYSSGQRWQWVRAMGGNKPSGAIRMNQGTAICTDANANVYMAGYFAGKAGNGANVINTYGYVDPLIVKYDSSGKLLWQRKLTDGKADYCYAACTDRADNVCVAGIESGHVISGFIARYDPDGNLSWIRETRGDESATYFRAIASDVVGNTYVAGDCQGAVTIGDSTVGSPGKYSIFLLKYDVRGDLLWVKQSMPGDNFYTQANALAIDADEHIYMAGSFVDQLHIDSTDIAGEGDRDIFAARFSRNGELEWLSGFGSRKADALHSIAVDNNGYFYLTAFFTAMYSNNGLRMKGEQLLKCAASGKLVWNTDIADADNESLVTSHVAADKDGTLYLTGSTWGITPLFGDPQVFCNGASDAFIAKCSHDGKVIWKQQFGGSGIDEGDAIWLDNASNIYVTGYFHTRMQIGQFTLNAASGDDGIWVGKMRE